MDATVEPPAEAKSSELEMAVDVYRHLDELEDLLEIVNDIQTRYKDKEEYEKQQQQPEQIPLPEEKPPPKQVPENYEALFNEYYEDDDTGLIDLRELSEYIYSYKMRYDILHLGIFLNSLINKNKHEIMSGEELDKVKNGLEYIINEEQKIIDKKINSNNVLGNFTKLKSILTKLKRLPKTPTKFAEITEFFYHEITAEPNKTQVKRESKRQTKNKRTERRIQQVVTDYVNYLLRYIDTIKNLNNYSLLHTFLQDVMGGSAHCDEDIKYLIQLIIEEAKDIIKYVKRERKLYSKLVLLSLDVHGRISGEEREFKTHTHDMKIIVVHTAPLGVINVFIGKTNRLKFDNFIKMFRENESNDFGVVDNVVEIARTFKRSEPFLNYNDPTAGDAVDAYNIHFSKRYNVQIISKGDKYLDKIFVKEDLDGILVVPNKGASVKTLQLEKEKENPFFSFSDIIEHFSKETGVKYLVILDNSCSVFDDFVTRIPDTPEIDDLETTTNTAHHARIIQAYIRTHPQGIPRFSYSKSESSQDSSATNSRGVVDGVEGSVPPKGGHKRTKKLVNRFRLYGEKTRGSRKLK